VDWYNNRRLLGSIGDVPPAEAEAAWHAAQDNLEATPMAA
jgi:transposase InsO family protein